MTNNEEVRNEMNATGRVLESLRQLPNVIEMITKKYDPEYGAFTEERSSGNESDVFEDGRKSGYHQALYDIGKMLGLDLEEPEEPDMIF